MSKSQISIRHICLILKLALNKCHIIIITSHNAYVNLPGSSTYFLTGAALLIFLKPSPLCIIITLHILITSHGDGSFIGMNFDYLRFLNNTRSPGCASSLRQLFCPCRPCSAPCSACLPIGYTYPELLLDLILVNHHVHSVQVGRVILCAISAQTSILLETR